MKTKRNQESTFIPYHKIEEKIFSYLQCQKGSRWGEYGGLVISLWGVLMSNYNIIFFCIPETKKTKKEKEKILTTDPTLKKKSKLYFSESQ